MLLAKLPENFKPEIVPGKKKWRLTILVEMLKGRLLECDFGRKKKMIFGSAPGTAPVHNHDILDGVILEKPLATLLEVLLTGLRIRGIPVLGSTCQTLPVATLPLANLFPVATLLWKYRGALL